MRSGWQSRVPVISVVDSSVIVGALHFENHASRQLARAAIATAPQPLAHAFSEFYSTLTRLPAPIRLSAQNAWRYLSGAFSKEAIVLNAKEHLETLALLSREGIGDGRIYDALIGAAPRSVGARLITADRRAMSVYSLVGVDFELLDAN